MTYQSNDTSVQNSRPRELYTITVEGTAYRYTSHQSDVVFDGDTFTALAGLERGEVPINHHGDQAEVTIDLATSAAVVFAIAGSDVPPATVDVMIQRMQVASGEAVTLWQGQVSSIGLEGVKASIRCTSEMDDPARSSLPRISCQRMCNHALYDSRCTVDRDDFIAATTIDDIISSTVIDVVDGDTLPDGWFNGGEIIHGTIRRTIARHVGNRLYLLLGFHIKQLGETTGIEDGDAVTMFPGCKHDIVTCEEKFDNRINFGGFPRLNGKANPFVRPSAWRDRI